MECTTMPSKDSISDQGIVWEKEAQRKIQMTIL
jgi:hypothetical protein